jgi:hypothetical protein
MTPSEFRYSLRQQTAYRLLRMVIDIVAITSLLTTFINATSISTGDMYYGGFSFGEVALSIRSMRENGALMLLTLTVSVVTTLAARMFAHLVIDIADTLQWQARKMASESDQASA